MAADDPKSDAISKFDDSSSTSPPAPTIRFLDEERSLKGEPRAELELAKEQELQEWSIGSPTPSPGGRDEEFDRRKTMTEAIQAREQRSRGGGSTKRMKSLQELPVVPNAASEPADKLSDLDDAGESTPRRARPPVVRFYRSLAAAPVEDVDLYIVLPDQTDSSELALERSLAEALAAAPPPPARNDGNPDLSPLSFGKTAPAGSDRYRTLEIEIDRARLPGILEIAAAHATPSPEEDLDARYYAEKKTLGKTSKKKGSSKTLERKAKPQQRDGEATDEEKSEPAVSLPELRESGRIRVRILVPTVGKK